ncbi:phosphoribosyltransferase [Streptomyces eurocidicus]|uniref:Phosphoribosyltransferase n=1 Tax=Streptomyces eurocidicus TaxID=66423 RepID=A0A2N8P407_STREU|nr:ComF family protein [Streptomyces eurocidicus]MBB5122648.1 putative amidophosphoribosyltransferase [Streptomyces eurocidicus]MBF6055792.1 ComF family protein [Streptomyces eurocidicus]PNE35758.1 phosphoribosyltransferase [Streptomyces eurocidicus]
MRGWWQEITGLVLPVDCAGCGRERSPLCEGCREALDGRAARPVRPDPAPAGLPVVHAASAYGGRVRSVLLAHKERGALGLAGPLGAALAGAVRSVTRALLVDPVVPGGAEERGPAPGARTAAAGPVRGPLLLVPVPSARRAVAARGHDPARRIALAAARALRGAGADARVAPLLRQRRPVADQSGLDARQRRANVAGALEVVRGGERWLTVQGPVVPVDDLMTTGASLAEASRALSRAGGRVLGAAVVAAPARAFGESGPGPGPSAPDGPGRAGRP